MKKIFFTIGILLVLSSCSTTQKAMKKSQNDTDIVEVDMPELKVTNETTDTIAEKEVYQATYEVKTEILHTLLKVSFDYKKRYLYGEATVTLKPKFYPTNEVVLDARGMDIAKVSLLKNGIPMDLKYTYDSLQLFITLDKTYTRDEKYDLYIKYTSKPDELPNPGGSAAITSDKGLYFIDPDDTDPYKPTQIWTQGETESNSVWFPTIDKPNMKHTQEIYMTVPAKYKTLSNGLLISSTNNADGTRTDYWKQDLPHAPYLTMMAVGDFSVTRDNWRGKEVSYYVEPSYERYARNIFGNTPEMIEFFSKNVTGVDYVWDKYSNVVIRDFVSGAMENTGAVTYFEQLQQTDREQLDRNIETIIAHELFHHWFGDLVTCESWSNLPLNESFANYSEYLWVEHKYGKDHADYENKGEQDGYLMESKNKQVDLIRYDYHSREDMFDGHSYNKGGRVLHMLRNYLGDDAFFAGYKNYLTTNKFKTGEVAQLRLAFEEVSGKDLNWFFNQWFLNSGHPILTYTYSYDASTQEAVVNVTQKASNKSNLTYTLPIAIDVYVAGKATRHKVVIDDKNEEFRFASAKPDFINADADKVILCVKKENKTTPEYIAQYNSAPLYLDRQESLDALADATGNNEVNETFYKALVDKHFSLRIQAIEALQIQASNEAKVIPELKRIALRDAKSNVRTAAIKKLSTYGGDQYADLYRTALTDSSYMVISAALDAIQKYDKNLATTEARKLMSETSPSITGNIMKILSNSDAVSTTDFPFFDENFKKASGFSKFPLFNPYTKYVLATKDNTIIDQAIQTLKHAYETSDSFWLKSPAKTSLQKIATYLKENGMQDKSNQVLEIIK